MTHEMVGVQKLCPSPEVQNFQVSLTRNKVKLDRYINDASPRPLYVFSPERYIALETTVVDTIRRALSVKVAPFGSLK